MEHAGLMRIAGPAGQADPAGQAVRAGPCGHGRGVITADGAGRSPRPGEAVEGLGASGAAERLVTPEVKGKWHFPIRAETASIRVRSRNSWD